MEDIEELITTDEWDLYQQSVDYMLLYNLYEDSNRNYRMYNGDQWYGLQTQGIEKVQLNFIKPIVDYKTTVINKNLWAIVYSSENYDKMEFKPLADSLCELLNKRASKIWERTKMDHKIRIESLDSAINDEGINYTYWNDKDKLIENEVIDKTDIYYGNEKSSDIQSQPYILIRKRIPVINAREMARALNVPEEKIKLILGDDDNLHNIGDNNQWEKDAVCTIITKLWKQDGKIHYSKATRLVQLVKDTDSGLNYYPIAHMTWSPKKGQARGEGIVRNLISNQIEVNKTLMRRAIVAKNTAYPQKIINMDYIQNPNAVDNIGATIKVYGTTNVTDAFSTTKPQQMSNDVTQLQNDLIEISRTLENASDVANGSTDPKSASGKAILAIQNASQETLNGQQSALKDFIEQIAVIWLDHIITYGKDLVLQNEIEDPMTGEKQIQNVKIPNSALKALKASVKIEVTPVSSFDQYAQELSLENLLQGGWFSPEKIDQLKLYVDALPNKSAMPKQKIQEIIKKEKAKQLYIQQVNAQTQLMYQQANQYIDSANQDMIDNQTTPRQFTEDEIRQDASRQAEEDFLAE